MHAESSYRDVMISSHTFTGSTLASGYRSVHDLMRCLRESKDTNKKNCKNCKNVSELEKKKIQTKTVLGINIPKSCKKTKQTF